MNTHYKTLGIGPGAAPEEIRSAYRRLAKRYHPDQDPSSEARYREIRAAYEALREWHLLGKADPSIPQSDAKDWATEYDIDWEELVYGKDKNLDKERIPFSLADLPRIFWVSLKELAAVGVVLQTVVAALIISFSYAPDVAPYAINGAPRVERQMKAPLPKRMQEKPYKSLVWGIAFVSGLVVVVLRYYVTLRHEGGTFCVLLIIAYSAAATLFVKWNYPAESVYSVTPCFAIASVVLILNPLGMLFDTLFDVVDSILKFH